jgi:hypothetical protein
LLATGDGPPMNGAFPTRLWRPGDVVADVHVIPWSDLDTWDLGAEGSYRVGVGLYDPHSGERLQAMQDGQPLPGNTVFIQR